MRFILAILAVAFIASTVNAAEGRRTAAVTGFLAGALTGYVVRDAMEVKPKPQVVYVESQPRTVIVERPTVVYVERPTVVYAYVEVRPAPQVVYVERREVRTWTPPIAHPFPQ